MDLCLSFDIQRGAFRMAADIDLAPGVTAIFGSTGCGKSTLLDCVSGILRPQSGTISFRGTTLFSSDGGVWVPPERRGFGYVF